MRNWFYCIVILLVLTTATGCDLLRMGVNSSFTIEHAKVERAFHAEADGHRFVAYMVTWKATQVVVSDPLCKSNHREGEEITFMAQRIAIPGGPKTLSFALAEP